MAQPVIRRVLCVSGWVVLAVASGLLFGSSPARTVAAPLAKPKPSQTPVVKGIGVVRLGDTYSTEHAYTRYAYVLVSAHDARAAARLPGTSLAYMSGTSIQRSWSTGVTYDEAIAHDWLLRDTAGRNLMNVQYGAFLADVGNPGYQRRFVDNVTAFLQSTKADGIFLDDVIANPVMLSGGVFPAGYPTIEAWEDAMVSFVAAVGSSLKSRGYYLAVNANKFVHGDRRSDTAELTAEFWVKLAPHVNGLMAEYWLQNPNNPSQLRALGSAWYENWDGWQRLVSVAQGAGTDFFGLGYGSTSDRRSMRYGKASFLLDWDGRGGAFVFNPRDGSDPHHPSWTSNVGRPVGSKVERVPGVWQRRYERAFVVVNATSAPVTIRINGTPFRIAATDALQARAPFVKAAK